MNAHDGSRARRGASIAVAGLALTSIVATGLVGGSTAAWTDSEWVETASAGLDCTAPGLGTSTAAGTMLGGELLGLDLATIVELDGVRVDNDGTDAAPTPASADPVPASDAEAWRHPLEVSAAFDAINLPLDDVLVLPLDTATGVYHQYARASDDLGSAAAAGAVTDTGGIALDAFSGPQEDRPKFGTLELGTVLTGATGEALSDAVTANLTDLRLELGALAGVAQLDGCGAAWSDDIYAELQRDYAIAGLDLDVDSPLVGSLVTSVQSTLTALEGAVAALSGDAGLTNALASGVLGSLSGVLGALGVGTPSATVAVTVDFSVVDALLDDTISDDEGIVEIDLATGTIGVDLAALLGEQYGTDGLNGLDPNTELLINEAVLTALTDAVSAALAGWVADVVSAIESALDLVQVSVAVTVPVSVTVVVTTVNLGNLVINIDGSLDELLAGSGTIDASLGLGSCGLVCAAVSTIVNGVLTGVEGSIAALGPVVGGLVQTALSTATGPLVAALESTLSTTSAALIGVLGGTLGGLFGTDGILSVLVNAQNDPDPAVLGAGAEPPSWASIPGAPSSAPFDSGRYDVAALVIGVVGAINAVEVVLARASVGGNEID